MSTAANLIVILTFLSALYLVLALISAAVEQALTILDRSRQRRRTRPVPRRRSPRRSAAPAGATKIRRTTTAIAVRPAA